MKNSVLRIIVLLMLAVIVVGALAGISEVTKTPDDSKDSISEDNMPITTAKPLETDIVEPEETEPNHVHEYGDYVVVTEATCKSEGLERATCKGCSGYLTREIPKLTTHTYDEGKITTEPTCAKAGVTTYTCIVCEKTKTGTIPKLTTHTYDSGKVTKEATCAATGVKTYTCSVCNVTKTETISKTDNHDYSSMLHTDSYEPIGNGQHLINYYQVCNNGCGIHKYSSEEEFCDPVDENGTVIQEPECEIAGVLEYTCVYCGDSWTDTIPETGHTPGEWDDDGNSDGCFNSEILKCVDCGETLDSRQEWTHSFVNGVCKYCDATE